MLLSTLCRRSTLTLLATACGLSFATPGLAETVYRYKTADGSYAYADDLKRVPERFRAEATAEATGSLSTYSRFTPTDNDAAKVQRDQLAERLDYLQRLNASLDARAAVEAGRGFASAGANAPMVRVGPENGSPVYVPAGDSDEGPVIVEEKRYRVANSFVTRHNTVVRRGDKVIAVYRGRPHVVGVSSVNDIQDESVLERR